MANELRSYAGGAVDTALTAGINSTDLSITINDPTGWPSGGAGGPFFIVASYDLAAKEKIEVQSRTGNVLTVANTGKRGIDGTTATSHLTGAKVRHCITAQDFDEFNAHAFDTARDDHTQYLNNARHDVTARHTIGSVVPAGTPGAIAPDDTAAAGSANSVARSDHRHSIATTTAVTSGLANAEGVATSFARADHTHDQAALSVGTAELVDLAVTSAKLGADSVIAGKIADGAVDVSASLVNGIVTLAKFASEASTAFVPDFPNVTIGTNGVKYGQYFKLGRLVFGIAGFQLGSGGTPGDVTGLISYTLPFAVADYFTGGSSSGWITAARAANVQAATVFSGLGIITDTGVCQDFVTAGTAASWSTFQPFDWNETDVFQSLFVFEATA